MKTVLITGAAKGIGNATAKRFADAGYKVIITYLTTKPQSGFDAYKLDLRDSKEVNSFAENFLKQYGCPDVVINNAGICQTKQVQDITDEDWHNMLDSNLSSAFYIIRAFAPEMISRRAGMFINVSSIWGELPASCESHYAASKAGLIALSKSLDEELKLSGVRVKYIAPGPVETDMMKEYTDEDRACIIRELGQILQPENVAEEIYKLINFS